MSEHTPEPWDACDGKNPGSTLIYSVAARHFPALLHIQPSPNSSVEQMHIDIRRILACVNACAGIPTAALEKSAVRSIIDAASALDEIGDGL